LFSNREEWLRRAPALLASQTAHLVQEVIPGASEALYQVSIYRDAGGRMLANSVTRKIRDYPRRFGIGTLVETVDMPELVAEAGRFLAAAEYSGIANVEFKFDSRTSRHTFLEINTRYFFPHELSVRAGVDFPWIHYRDLSGQRPEAPQMQQAGMRWTSFGLDLRASLESMREGELGVGQWLGSFRGVRCEAFFALDDLRPFLRYVAGLVRLPLPAAKTERSAHVSRPVAPAR
jgi:predicted ATP-grasp superfamily ATP-dependent carboligase